MIPNWIYLVYIDILGFGPLAKEIEVEKGIETRVVRKNFISVINEKIEDLKMEHLIIGAKSHNDDWTIVVEDRQNVLIVISRILDHYTGYKDYKRIPLEIAVGMQEYDKRSKLKGRGLICEDKTIEFLKSGITEDYREWYKKNNNNKSIKKTFVVATEPFFNELPLYDQKLCREIRGTKTPFFCLPLKLIDRERKISDFLKEIGQERSDFSGALIDRIFIPPDGFNEIKNTLNTDRIVFITGTAGYGKTYTTIRLLWEYYNKGYNPRWIPGKEEAERSDVRKKLSYIETQLEPGYIIYFEDPFGKTNYERRDDLKERINHVTNTIRNKEDVYVIITSRKDVFEKFESESYSVHEIKKFEKELNILKPSYNMDKRKHMLEKWALEKECKWLEIKELRLFVFKSIENDRNLPTPLSIHDFVESTINIINLDQLKKDVYSYSRSSENAFADEIIGLYESGREDRVLFLSFIFISQFNVDFVKQEYDKIKKKDFESFENILNEEYRVKESISTFDKIIFDSSAFQTNKILEFAHPSYSGSIKYLLKHPGCKRIFSEVAVNLLDLNVDVDVREKTIEVLGEIGKPIAIKSLINTLKDRNSNVRDKAAKTLGKIGDLKAVQPLIQTLKDPDQCVRGTAAYALGNMRSSKAVPPLIQTLRDPKSYVRREVARALGKMGEIAIEQLVNTLKDPNEEVKIIVIIALGDIGGPKVVEPLINTLKDPSKIIRMASIRALIKTGKLAIKPLIHNLKFSEDYCQEAAAVSLGEIGDPKAVEPLIQSLDSSNWKVKKASIKALCKIGNPKSVKFIIKALEDPNDDVRLVAAVALGKLGNSQALKPLNKALEDENIFVQKAAKKSLNKISNSRPNFNTK